MKLYLFRHGEKLSSVMHSNPPLSPRGEAQAIRLLEKVQNTELPKPSELWVSPKTRTQQTFLHVANAYSLKLQILPDLEEQQASETGPQFRARVQAVLNRATQTEGVVFVCSHFDWLEEALRLIPSDEDLSREPYQHWSPLQYIGFNLKDEIFHFLEHKRIPL